MSVFISLKHAARASWRAPAFSAIVIIVLGLGIGATTAIFSVVNSVLLTPLPYRDWDRIVTLWQRAPESSVSRGRLSPGQYTEILERSSSFEELALFYGGPILLTLQGPAEEVGFLVARASFSSQQVGRRHDDWARSRSRHALRQLRDKKRPHDISVAVSLWQ